MSDRGFRRWVGLGVLASAMVFGAACNKGAEQPGESGRALPKEGSNFEGHANEAQPVESFGQGQQPATGGSGQQQGQPMRQTQPPGQQPASPGAAQRLGSEEASGAQGRQGGIGAPGYSTPQEPGSKGTGATGGEAGQGGTSAPGAPTESGGTQRGK